MKSLIGALLIAALPIVTQADQAAITLRDTSLLADATQLSATITQLNKDSQVILLARKGGWYKVKSSDQQVGWLRMLSVRFVTVEEAQKDFLAELVGEAALVAPASGVATGIRGATEEKLAEKDHDPSSDLKKIKHYVPTESELQQFAEEGALTDQEIADPE